MVVDPAEIPSCPDCSLIFPLSSFPFLWLILISARDSLAMHPTVGSVRSVFLLPHLAILRNRFFSLIDPFLPTTRCSWGSRCEGGPPPSPMYKGSVAICPAVVAARVFFLVFADGCGGWLMTLRASTYRNFWLFFRTLLRIMAHQNGPIFFLFLL